MRILVCSSVAPVGPVKTGHQLQVERLLDELRRRHTVRVVAPWRGAEGPMPTGFAELRLVSVSTPARSGGKVRAAMNALAAWARGRPVTIPRIAPQLQRAVADELDEFDPDVVHVTFAPLAELALDVSDWPSVLAPLDAEHLNISAIAELHTGIYRLAWRIESALVKRFQHRHYPHFDRVVVVTTADARALETLTGDIASSVIPNGVDASHWSPGGRTARLPGRLVFTGVMDFAPNVAAATYLAREILPAVREACPAASLAIVGRNPSKDVRGLAEIEGVEVAGEVPDLEPWLSAGSVFVCPMLSGTGIKNKLLEALANGLPCVATPLAVQGLGVRSGRELLVACDREELIRDVIRLLQNRELAESIGGAGARYVRDRHTWSGVAARYEDLYREVIASRTARDHAQRCE